MNSNKNNLDIRCVQINLQKSRKATYALCRHLEEKGIHIAFLQEPYTIKNRVAGFPNSYRILQAGTTNKVRAAIVITNPHIISITNINMSTEDMIWAEFKIENFTFWTASIYLDKTKDINVDLRVLDENLSKIKSRLLLCLDSNARNISWFDRITDQRGKLFEDFLASKNLHFLNIDLQKSTFETIRASSNPDLTITNNAMLNYVHEWYIDDEDSLSDHKYLSFTLKSNSTNRQTYTNRFNTKKANWDKFKDEITKRFKISLNSKSSNENDLIEALKICHDIETTVDSINSDLTTACSKSMPRQKKTFNKDKKKVPWWSTEIESMRKKVRDARRKYQKTKKDEDLRNNRKNIFYSLLKQYKMLIDQAKYDSWKNFCTNSSNPWETAYKSAANKIKPTQVLTTLQKKDGTFTEGIADTLEELMNKFLPKDDPKSDNDNHKLLRGKMYEKSSNQCNDPPFTVFEVKTALSRTPNGKAPGEDGITNEILKKSFEVLPQFFTALFNECFERGVFPKCWKVSNIIVIQKPGKESIKTASKYRPISLLPSLAKLLERLMIDRIMFYLYSNNLLSENQFGFRPQTNTTDAIMKVKEFVESHLKIKMRVALVSLDVEGAFDAAWWPMIIHRLKILDCPKNLLTLVQSYFTDRSSKLSMDSFSKIDNPTCGCPQGSSSSPGFWNIQYDSLLQLLLPPNCHSIAFADDYLLLAAARTEDELEVVTNEALRRINNWAIQNKLYFSKDKSQFLYVTRQKKRELNVYLDTTKLKSETCLKYLGVYLTDNWTWGTHIRTITSKIQSFVHILSRSAKLHWGLGCKALKVIYDAAFCPMILYAAPVWIDGLQIKANQQRLKTCQRLIALRMIKGYRTISYEASCVLAGILPICEEAYQAYDLYKVQKGTPLDWIESKNLEHPLNYRFWSHPAQYVEGLITDDLDDSNFTLSVYTDGSKSDVGVGCAFAVYSTTNIIFSETFKLSTQCSNYQAEQFAIIKAIEWLLKRNDQDCKYVIRTDSKSTLDSLNSIWNHSPLLMKIRNLIQILPHGQISFSWVKAHIGIEGNEKADSLAKEASEDESLPISYKFFPKSYMILKSRKRRIENWNQIWTNTPNGAITKLYFPSINHRLKFGLWDYSYKLTMFITGHGKFNTYLKRFNLRDSSSCICDNSSDQSPLHLIYDCKVLERERFPLIQHICSLNYSWPVPTNQLLVKDIKEVFLRFIENINFEKLSI